MFPWIIWSTLRRIATNYVWGGDVPVDCDLWKTPELHQDTSKATHSLQKERATHTGAEAAAPRVCQHTSRLNPGSESWGLLLSSQWSRPTQHHDAFLCGVGNLRVVTWTRGTLHSEPKLGKSVKHKQVLLFFSFFFFLPKLLFAIDVTFPLL